MSGKFSMDDYVDVAERIRDFHARYPDGSLQAEVVYVTDPPGWFASAQAYRSPDDPRPGIGHAFEPVPGKTPYTRDSECMNAETSAWGRAIVALGFDTKKIASAQEVRARSGSGGAKGSSGRRAGGTPAAASTEPAAAERLLAIVTELGGDDLRQSTLDAIKTHAAEDADAGEGWIVRQIERAQKNLETKRNGVAA